MPKAPNMYKCSICGGYMTFKERTKKRVILTRRGSKVQYDQDLCPPCDTAEAEGKDLKLLGSYGSKADGKEQEPTQVAEGGGGRHGAKTNGVPGRRSRSTRDTDDVPNRRSRSTTSGAR